MKQPLTLKKNGDFRKVYQQGKSIANRNLVLHYLKRDLPETRIGITVSRKVGKSVVRNRVKRRIRECLGELKAQLPVGYDLVWIARSSCQDADYHILKSAARHLLVKLFHSQPRKETHVRQPDNNKDPQREPERRR